MQKINEIPLDFIIKNLRCNTVQMIEIKWELLKRCKESANISAVCRQMSEELDIENKNYSPMVLRHMVYS